MALDFYTAAKREAATVIRRATKAIDKTRKCICGCGQTMPPNRVKYATDKCKRNYNNKMSRRRVRASVRERGEKPATRPVGRPKHQHTTEQAKTVWQPRGGTLEERINRIVERDMQSRLAPQ
jgi:hypothetical protein